MFNLFRGKTPRAIANLKDIRGILDKIIPSADSIKALEELSGWLGSVTAAATLASDVRGLALCMVDETTQDHVRALIAGAARAVRADVILITHSLLPDYREPTC